MYAVYICDIWCGHVGRGMRMGVCGVWGWGVVYVSVVFYVVLVCMVCVYGTWYVYAMFLCVCDVCGGACIYGMCI